MSPSFDQSSKPSIHPSTSHLQSTIPRQLSCCIESSTASIHPTNTSCRVSSLAGSHSHGSTLPHKQHRQVHVHQWSCPLVNAPTMADGTPERPPDGVHAASANKGPTPLVAYSSCPTNLCKSRGAWPQERSWSLDQRRNVLQN